MRYFILIKKGGKLNDPFAAPFPGKFRTKINAFSPGFNIISGDRKGRKNNAKAPSFQAFYTAFPLFSSWRPSPPEKTGLPPSHGSLHIPEQPWPPSVPVADTHLVPCAHAASASRVIPLKKGILPWRLHFIKNAAFPQIRERRRFRMGREGYSWEAAPLSKRNLAFGCFCR